jgi:hypothetical protein
MRISIPVAIIFIPRAPCADAASRLFGLALIGLLGGMNGVDRAKP